MAADGKQTIVILTALEVEYTAVRGLLADTPRRTH